MLCQVSHADDRSIRYPFSGLLLAEEGRVTILVFGSDIIPIDSEVGMPGKRSGTIEVGISSCLLGQKVRFDGGHKQDRYIKDILGAYFRFVPVCPELEVGMGVPREAVRLTGLPESPAMIGIKSGRDWTDNMNQYARKRVSQSDLAGLYGYILKKDSPSCGMERVKVYEKSKMPVRSGRGLFAAALIDRFPLLPIEEEGRLNDPSIRENFIERVFAYHRLRNLFERPHKRGDVVIFHSAHKLTLMAHSQKHYQVLGKMVAAIKDLRPAQFRDEYQTFFMEALKIPATVKKNVNVLQHILGYFREKLSAPERESVGEMIEDYRLGVVPLIVPITIMRHYVKLLDISYIADQIYLNPHPKELMLRNHA